MSADSLQLQILRDHWRTYRAALGRLKRARDTGSEDVEQLLEEAKRAYGDYEAKSRPFRDVLLPFPPEH